MSDASTPAETLQVWRLLAETQMLQGDAAAAAASYQTADSKAGGGGIELLSAWTDALVAAGKPQKARFRFHCCFADHRQAPGVIAGHRQHAGVRLLRPVGAPPCRRSRW
jgi:hypothetical protein